MLVGQREPELRRRDRAQDSLDGRHVSVSLVIVRDFWNVR